MNKEWKDKWVAALRSGEYKQGIEALRYTSHAPGNLFEDVKAYCCLGVLCDLVAKEYPDQFYWEDDIFHFKKDGRVYEESYVLPGAVIDIVGEPSIFPQTLMSYNDNARYSFNKIADLLEGAKPKVTVRLKNMSDV